MNAETSSANDLQAPQHARCAASVSASLASASPSRTRESARRARAQLPAPTATDIARHTGLGLAVACCVDTSRRRSQRNHDVCAPSIPSSEEGARASLASIASRARRRRSSSRILAISYFVHGWMSICPSFEWVRLCRPLSQSLLNGHLAAA